MARQMSNYLVNFISSGNPNGKETNEEDMPEWEPFTAESPYAMVFGDTVKFLKEQPDELMAFLVRQYFKKD